MSLTSKIRHEGISDLKGELDLEPPTAPLPVEPGAESPDDDIERRLYYIRGTNRGERVVATIRARNRKHALKIAIKSGIKVDRRELVND